MKPVKIKKMQSRKMSNEEFKSLIKAKHIKETWTCYDEYGLEEFVESHCTPIMFNGDIEVYANVSSQKYVTGRFEGNHADVVIVDGDEYDTVFLTITDDVILHNEETHEFLMFQEENAEHVTHNDQGSFYEGYTYKYFHNDLFMREYCKKIRLRWSNIECLGMAVTVKDFLQTELKYEFEDNWTYCIFDRNEEYIGVINGFEGHYRLLRNGDILIFFRNSDFNVLLKRFIVHKA